MAVKYRLAHYPYKTCMMGNFGHVSDAVLIVYARQINALLVAVSDRILVGVGEAAPSADEHRRHQLDVVMVPWVSEKQRGCSVDLGMNCCHWMHVWRFQPL